VTSNREPLQAEGVLIVRPGRLFCKRGSQPASRRFPIRDPARTGPFV